MGCQRVTSLPLLSVDVNGCDRNPANPCMEPSIVTRNGRPSYWGAHRRGSSERRHFNVTKAFCCSAPHLFFSDAVASALLLAPFRMRFELFGGSTLMSRVRSESGAAIHA